MRGVEMRVRYYYCCQTAAQLDGVDGFAVEEGYEVPEDVSVRGLQEDGAFAYS